MYRGLSSEFLKLCVFFARIYEISRCGVTFFALRNLKIIETIRILKPPAETQLEFCKFASRNKILNFTNSDNKKPIKRLGAKVYAQPIQTWPR